MQRKTRGSVGQPATPVWPVLFGFLALEALADLLGFSIKYKGGSFLFIYLIISAVLLIGSIFFGSLFGIGLNPIRNKWLIVLLIGFCFLPGVIQIMIDFANKKDISP